MNPTEYIPRLDDVDTSWATTESEHRRNGLAGDQPAPRRRVRGLRFPDFAATAMAQVLGGVAALAGTYVQWGIGATLIAGGAAAVVLGMLREAGKV